MKLPRPYIPVLTRCLVARRQLREQYGIFNNRARGESLSAYLEVMLQMLAPVGKHSKDLQLDHDPALEVRKKVFEDGVHVEYSPRANDHRYLAYRLTDQHLQKTTGRKPGAERTATSKGSDNWIAKKFRRLEGEPKRKAKIASRPFPKRRSF